MSDSHCSLALTATKSDRAKGKLSARFAHKGHRTVLLSTARRRLLNFLDAERSYRSTELSKRQEGVICNKR
jgi:hypothetical protein